MRLSLAALGWVSDAPSGNRLRWSVEAGALAGDDAYAGLPESVVLERAPVDEDLPWRPEQGGGAAGPLAPFSWWDNHGDIAMAGFLPGFFEMPAPVQAVRFVYRGAPARLRVLHMASGAIVAERLVSDGDPVNIDGSSLDRIEVTAFGAVLEDLATLDLHSDRGLAWETIAKISVAPTADVGLDDAATRLELPTTLSHEHWQELTDLARDAAASRPSDAEPGEPTAWEAFEMMIALRWEHAVLYGLGFVDGPHGGLSKLDRINKKRLLPGPPSHAVAYRVLDADERFAVSNVIVCPPWTVAPLAPPAQPVYERAETRLTTDPETDQLVFRSTYLVRWRQTDANALGVAVEEETSASPVSGAPATHETYECRTRFAEDPPFEGALARDRIVAFHDVSFRCQARATDGWDRESAPSLLTGWCVPRFEHAPAAPCFAAARYDAGVVSLTLQTGSPGVEDWVPDPVIAADPTARVAIYRRKSGASGKPTRAMATAGTPGPVHSTACTVSVSGGAPLGRFENGSIVAPAFKARILGISGSEITYGQEDGAMDQLAPGAVTLLQDPMHLDLWTKVAEFDPGAIGTEVSFPDPLPAPAGGADTLSYHARISFLGGRIGPNGNTVQAVRVLPTPAVPPPFDVEPLGLDFYNRTMLRIRFTTPVSDGLYTVWWAHGALTDAAFESKGVPGEMRAQPVHQSRYLYDVLPLPLPRSAVRTVTIGVQCLNSAQGQSPFETVQISLLPIAS